MSAAKPSIPLIDFNPFLHGSTAEREQVAGAIDAALCSVGFLYLTNHGNNGDTVDECFRWVSLLSPLLSILQNLLDLRVS